MRTFLLRFRRSRHWLCALVLTLAACAHLPPQCDPDQARALGLSLGMRGRPRQLFIPPECGETYTTVYRDGFDDGYTRGLEHHCDASKMEEVGRQQAMAGKTGAFTDESYQLCPNRSAMETFFRRGYRDGLTELCSAEGAESVGKTAASAGRPETFPEETYRACSQETWPMLRKAYERGFQSVKKPDSPPAAKSGGIP